MDAQTFLKPLHIIWTSVAQTVYCYNRELRYVTMLVRVCFCLPADVLVLIMCTSTLDARPQYTVLFFFAWGIILAPPSLRLTVVAKTTHT